jgi:hypothetical protein
MQPTKFLGDRKMGEHAPLNGPWRLLFTTATDATFSSNSTRGDALVQNIMYAAEGRVANVIDFFVTRRRSRALTEAASGYHLS